MDERLTNYFSGKISDADKLRLFEELEADELFKKEFVLVQHLYSLSKMVSEEGDDAYAARNFDQFKSGIRKHQLRQMPLLITKYAALLFLLIASYVMFDRFTADRNKVNYTRLEVPVGQSRLLTLADGTKVMLGPNTRITYPDKFINGKRMVELDGEALFTVAEEKNRPFVVKTSKYNIRVSGTKFNVYAYSESDQFETTLICGSICIDDGQADSKKIYLKSSEKAEASHGSLVKAPMTMADAGHFNDGIYSFEEESVGEVLERLERYYGVELKVSNSSLLTCSFSGEFKSKDRIEDALSVMQQFCNFKYKRISENITEIY